MAHWDKYVIDATMGWPPCFCPIEGDIDGDFQIVTGLNIMGYVPGEVVAVVHEDGQDAVEEFYQRHKEELDELLGKETSDD